MAMIAQHPSPGVDTLPPGIQARGRVPRAGMAALVNAYFPMPQNPVNPGANALNKSLMQVSGIPTSIGPGRTQMHGIGNYYDGINGLSDTFGEYGQYAVYAVGAVLLASMFGMFGFGKKRRNGGPKATAAPAAA